MIRLLLVLAAVLGLAACANNPTSAPTAEVTRAAYSMPGQPELKLITMISNRTGKGGHTALLINASQRVIFDPAGSFHHPQTPRSGDVLYGISPAFEDGYLRMHARPEYHAVVQTITVSPEVAEKALQLAQANGPAPGAYCANHTARLLRQLPGFENVDQTFYPRLLAISFSKLPGVRTNTLYEEFIPVAGADNDFMPKQRMAALQ
ncbi:hypothetical protein [Pseudooceanicola nanhaiensis]|uniref:hypothetical protein n=1 Tax=Pseudooceanicola nanhaiensis TaxID=375761 RepID=UPI001CD1EE40|nr:hypothetical protein [Pseudooceanicola nanhaiensis]MCA0920614.1 hypothetical protein [Pseudooceanicola nanhaiensis]